MAELREIRFGTNIRAASRSELIKQLHRAEEIGYSSVAVTDHVSQPRWAPIATLAALAMIESTIKLTSTVFGNDFRHPAILASEIATIDLISNGRLELGIGTGYMTPDYEQTGIAFDRPGIRVDRLIETIQILKALFSGESVSFTGQYYTIRDLTLMPKPMQRPHPRLLLGGGGKRVLSLAAREADIVSINPIMKEGGLDLEEMLPRVFTRKLEWIRNAAGERFADLELHSMLFAAAVTDEPYQAAEQWLEQIRPLANPSTLVDVDDVLASPYTLIGTTGQIIEKLKNNRERFGVSYYTTASYIGMDALSSVVENLPGK